MKYSILIILLVLTSCTEEINLNVSDANPRLVVDARIEVDKTNPSKPPLAVVLLSRSVGFFDEKREGFDDFRGIIGDAKVYITSDKGDNYILDNITDDDLAAQGIQLQIETYQKIYSTDKFVLQDNVYYTLHIELGNQKYESVPQKIYRTPSLIKYEAKKREKRITFGDKSDENTVQFELVLQIQDNPKEENYYIYSVDVPEEDYPDLTFADDKLANGKVLKLLKLDGYLILDQEAEVEYRIYATDQRYHDYLRILNSLSGKRSGGPFNTQPVEARGNMFNRENANDNPFGYFRVIERDKRLLTLKK